MAEYHEPASSRMGRFIDYLVGRNALIGVASLMLLCLSGYATWSGMNDFIVGVSSAGGSGGSGALDISNSFIVIAIVVALTFLMWLALRETFAKSRLFTERMITLPLYIFLALWSIGFGYGFWWSLIAGEEATRTSLSGLQEDARDAGAVVAARLDAVRIQLDNVVAWSETQMAREESSGGSCGIASGAGQGPLYNARRGVRDGLFRSGTALPNHGLVRCRRILNNCGAVRRDLEVELLLNVRKILRIKQLISEAGRETSRRAAINLANRRLAKCGPWRMRFLWHLARPGSRVTIQRSGNG